MRTLTLNVTGQYFGEMRDLTKSWEYRLVTPYWRKRLEGKTFDQVVIKWGYPKADDASRHLVRPWRGYEIQTITHPHFGPNPVEVYAIRVN